MSSNFAARSRATFGSHGGRSGTVICMPGEWSEGEYGWLYGDGKPTPRKAAPESSDLPPPNLPPPGSTRPQLVRAASADGAQEEAQRAQDLRLRAAGLDRVPRRRARLGVGQDRQGRRRARRSTSRRPARHDLSPGRLRQPPRADAGGAEGALDRRRRRWTRSYRHDHAAAHRQRPDPADVAAARLARRRSRATAGPRSTPRTRSAALPCWSRPSSRTPASGSTTTSRSASADWSRSSTRSAASRSVPRTNIKDKDSGLDVKKGCQNADGKTALAYSRNRHSYATQDIQRVQSQREVLGSIAAEAKSPWTVLNPFRYMRVASGASGSLQIGENVGPISLAKFALALSAAMSGKGLNCTVPLRDFAVTWDPERAPKMFDLHQDRPHRRHRQASAPRTDCPGSKRPQADEHCPDRLGA